MQARDPHLSVWHLKPLQSPFCSQYFQDSPGGHLELPPRSCSCLPWLCCCRGPAVHEPARMLVQRVRGMLRAESCLSRLPLSPRGAGDVPGPVTPFGCMNENEHFVVRCSWSRGRCVGPEVLQRRQTCTRHAAPFLLGLVPVHQGSCAGPRAKCHFSYRMGKA